MSSSILSLLRSHRSRFLDRLSLRILESLPHYRLTCLPELRNNLEGFFDDLIQAIQFHNTDQLMQRAIAISQKRADQGFSVCEIVRAVLLSLPVIREIASDLGDCAIQVVEQSWVEIEATLHQLAAIIADGYVEAVSRKLAGQNQELNHLNQQLRLREQVLALENSQVSQALNSVNEFNHRVIESLTSGVVVVDRWSQTVTLYSCRMEEILGIPAKEVMGRHISETFAGIQGLDVKSLVAKVLMSGRLPLTKLHLTMPNGQQRSVYLRAQRLLNANGDAEGTVVVVDDITERELLIDSFSRYVSRDVVQRLLVRSQPLELDGERQVCTLLFVDIRGFTELSEILPPEVLHELLNDYFRVIIDAIAAYGGFIDKFIGDKVMAIFKQPSSAADSANAAVEAAMAIQQRLQRLSRDRISRGEIPLYVGIGINTGEVFLGNIGSDERMDFTAIGDAVNVADRLQNLARRGEILLGEATAQLVRDRVQIVERGVQILRGRIAPINVFELKLPRAAQPAQVPAPTCSLAPLTLADRDLKPYPSSAVG